METPDNEWDAIVAEAAAPEPHPLDAEAVEKAAAERRAALLAREEGAPLPGPDTLPGTDADRPFPGEKGRIVVDDLAQPGDRLTVVVYQDGTYLLEASEGSDLAAVRVDAQGADDIIEALSAGRPAPVELTEAGMDATMEWATQGGEGPVCPPHECPEGDLHRLFGEALNRSHEAVANREEDRAATYAGAASDLARVLQVFRKDGRL